jgi:hypothetical protein
VIAVTIRVKRDMPMAERKTKDWMDRKKLKAVTVYFHDMVFERVQAAAKEDGRSKGNWVHKIIIEAPRKRSGQ